MDVRKEINFCRRVSLPVLGVVENMSGYACPSCGHTERIFSPSTGGALAMCQQMEAWSEKQVYSIGATPSRFCRDFADLIGALVSVMPPTLSMRFTWDAVAHSPACSATHRTRCRSWAQCRWTAGWLRRGTRDCRSPNSIRMGRWPSASTRSSTPFCSKRTRSSARLELGCTKHPSLGTDAAMLVSSPTAECLYGQIGCIASQENSKGRSPLFGLVCIIQLNLIQLIHSQTSSTTDPRWDKPLTAQWTDHAITCSFSPSSKVCPFS